MHKPTSEESQLEKTASRARRTPSVWGEEVPGPVGRTAASRRSPLSFAAGKEASEARGGGEGEGEEQGGKKDQNLSLASVRPGSQPATFSVPKAAARVESLHRHSRWVDRGWRRPAPAG